MVGLQHQSGIKEIFWTAQLVVTHPIGPVFDLEMDELTPKCNKVMRRIFRYFDNDRDDHLSNDELRRFQQDCFNVPLSDDDIASLTKALAAQAPNVVTHTPRGISERGFLAIFEVFIRSHTPQALWKVLRYFGYDDDLRLVDAELQALSTAPQVNETQACELSAAGKAFLVSIFNQFALEVGDDRAPSAHRRRLYFEDQGGDGSPNSWPLHPPPTTYRFLCLQLTSDVCCVRPTDNHSMTW